MSRPRFFVPFFGSLVLVACGGATMPAASPRESGQSGLVDKTFAGKNKCNPKSHDRPFVVEWDATDMSSFEAKAATDVVFVRYEGCELRVLDCADDSLHGSVGSYGPVEWTSGAVEKVDIADEGELFAKLPLGAASLGGRVSSGEKFHMEYYVSGTRKATRPEVYQKDLAKLPRCKGATHFVYAYNLGAFALGSEKTTRASAGATVWGMGAGATKTSLDSAEKKGGVLTSCTGESAKEIASCKVPVRLTLREVAEGGDPQAAAETAQETPAAANLAGKIQRKLDQNERARGYWEAAQVKLRARDGKGCLAELDKRDKADPRPASLSTNPASPAAPTRAECVMLAGQCDAGKAQYRKAVSTVLASEYGPEVIDRAVDQTAGQYCQGASMSPRDRLLSASRDLSLGASTRKDAAFCRKAYDAIRTLSAKVDARDADDTQVSSAKMSSNTSHQAARCLARAGDCEGAMKAYAEEQPALSGANLTQAFATVNPECAGSAATAPKNLSEAIDGAMSSLVMGAAKATTASACTSSYQTVTNLGATVSPSDPSPTHQQARNASYVKGAYMNCLVTAGDCASAGRVWDDVYGAMYASLAPNARAELRKTMLRTCGR